MKKQFKHLREIKNISRKSLEEMTNSSSGQVSKFEAGKSNPTLSTIKSWLDSMNLQIFLIEKTNMEVITTTALLFTKDENVFKKSILKLRQLEKNFRDDGGIDNENVAEQLSGYIMYQIDCFEKDTYFISDFIKKVMAFYREHHNSLTDYNNKHVFFNQFVFLFNSKSV